MSMQGKVVVITGSNTGIGFETAVGVAAQGATTVLACRNQTKADTAAKEVVQRTWNDDVHAVPLDLADLASVQKAADELLNRWDRLDVLVNNAGGTWSQRQVTAQGIEYTLGVNHLGHFFLTLLLLDRLRAGDPSRVVNVTSVGHHFAPKGMRFDDLQSEHGYEAMEVYCRAKLANVLFTRELARRTPALGGDRQRRPSRLGQEQVRDGRRPDWGSWGSGSGPCGRSRSAPDTGRERRSTYPSRLKRQRRPACTGFGRSPAIWAARPGTTKRHCVCGTRANSCWRRPGSPSPEVLRFSDPEDLRSVRRPWSSSARPRWRSRTRSSPR